MTNVQIAGVGLTKLGSHPERTGRDLFAEAALAAREDAGVSRDDYEEIFYGNFMGELAEKQDHQGLVIAETAGLDCPATRYEQACAPAGVAFRQAVATIRSGAADVVLTDGMERMNNLGTAEVTQSLAIAADELSGVRAGVTSPGAHTLVARAYFDAFGGGSEDLVHTAVKNHVNAMQNDYAQFHREITVDDALESPVVADPPSLYDACPIINGVSAVVLVSDDHAERHGLDAPVSVTGPGQGDGKATLQDRPHLARTPAVTKAVGAIYADADIGPDDVDVAGAHDCFTIAEVLALEPFGLCDHGEDVDATVRGETTRDGDLPVNLSGGLEAKGHPVGTTGTAQVVEMTKLLHGDHGNNDAVPDARVGVTHNASGTVASTVAHVLEVDR